MIPTCAVIGAIAGLSLQIAVCVWALKTTGHSPGLPELVVMGVISLFIAGTGGVMGAGVGAILKELTSTRRKDD